MDQIVFGIGLGVGIILLFLGGCALKSNKKEIEELRARLNELEVKSTIKAQDELALTERKKKQFEKILNEMFPD